MLSDFPGTKWGHYYAAELISVRPQKGFVSRCQQWNDHASGLAVQILVFSHKSMKHGVTVTALCLKTAAREQSTCAASQGINQLLAPFTYYLLFYSFDKVFNGIKALSISSIVIQFGFSEIA